MNMNIFQYNTILVLFINCFRFSFSKNEIRKHEVYFKTFHNNEIQNSFAIFIRKNIQTVNAFILTVS